MTLAVAKAQGYEVLSGPYTLREEKLMLRALDQLQQTPSIPHMVVRENGNWYIMRKGMMEVPPESDSDPTPVREPRQRLQVSFSGPLSRIIATIAKDRYKGVKSLAVEEACIAAYAPEDVKLQMLFRREAQQVMKKAGTTS